MTAERHADASGRDGQQGRTRGDAATYSTPGPLPIDDVDPGSNFLCTGPTMTGKSRALSRILGDGVERGEGAILVTTESDARAALATDGRLREAAGMGEGAPVGVVDCITESSGAGRDGDDVVAYVSSPADLTGVGVEFNRHLERLHHQGVSRYRVLVDSLTPFFVYRDAEQVFKFLQVLTGRIASLGGLGFVVGHSDAGMDEEAERLKGLFDGVIEFREQEGKVGTRAIGPYATAEGWVPYEEEPTSGEGSTPGESTANTDGRQTTARDGASPSETPLASGIDSLSSAIDAVADAGRTLTLCNFDGDRDTLSDLRAYFERLNVTVTEASLSSETPRNVALLHQGDQHLASATVEDLASTIAVEGVGEEHLEGATETELMVLARQEAFATRKSWRRHLVRTSRLIEAMAWNAGTGTVHAGFQDLSRLTSDPDTKRIYDRIAEGGVEVHLYGRPDAEVDRDRFVVHDDAVDEIERSWFVVFTDGEEPSTAGALVAEERQRGTYSGFWTYRTGTAVAVRDYLEATYGQATV
ncbi:hypothetical protein BRD00_12955 [Halobacteriales archaeon QS_8_69_26]|nr:MAG: hypothetical protein BRD00_12955 [Halobacteriales archaeon QS_8_69_26]